MAEEAKIPDIIIGVWTLISFKLQPVDGGETIMPHGPNREDHRGRGIMTADGFMGAFVSTEKELIKLPKADFVANSDEDVARIARAFSSYCGRLSLSDVKGLSGLVHTDVELALNPAWIGGRQTRRFTMERSGGNDYMTLQPVEPMLMTDGKRYLGTLRWEKLKLPGYLELPDQEGKSS